MEKLGINAFQLLAQGVNFLILMFVLKKFLLKPLLALLEKRKASISEQIKAEEDLSKRIKDTERKDQAVLKQAKLKADEIIKQAQVLARKEAVEILAATRQESKKILARADMDAKLEFRKSQARLQTMVIKEAAVLANRALAEVLSKEDQKKITEVQIAKLVKGEEYV
ncbi:F0F1 ATP synthase subunit B [Candidatus Collierbacteria bacterium]|nr:F0F1 ATP synthase subunit B [Candidatus Collierbacteria bacterium]